MFFSNIYIVFALGITAFAKPISDSLTVHERRDVAPNGFTLIGPADEASQLTLRIALTSTNLAGLEKALYKTAFRSDGVIRDHLTKEEVESFVSPTNETTIQVAEWLSSHGVTSTTTSPAGNWLQINVDVATANHLLDANFMSFKDESTGKEIIRTLSYSIPTQLQPHIQFIHLAISTLMGDHRFPVKAQRSPLTLKKTKLNAQITPKTNTSNLTGRANVTCCLADEVDPTCLLDLYQIPDSTAPQTTSRIGVAEFSGQFPQKADLESFLKTLRPDLPSTLSFTLATLDGGSDPQDVNDAGIEANLDVQYTVGLAVNVPVEVIEVGADNEDDLDGFLDLANFLLDQTSPPQVLSLSFGFDEDDVSANLANSLCNAYMQLGARGVSVIAAAGDGGVSGSQSQSCTKFIPTFPSTCPFVTSVGATQGFSPETAADFSAGGFSNLFSAPSYQATAVKKYLSSLGTTNAGKFNSSGRGFPDVSAQGVNIVIFDGGEEGTVSGSPASVDIFSSVIGLLNAQLISSGLPVAGFLNPLLYSDPSILNDITSGDNPGCNTNGFSATSGWDPVSGLGTPNYLAMLQPGF